MNTTVAADAYVPINEDDTVRVDSTLFISYGCCVPTSTTIWMLIVMLFCFFILVGCFCGAGILVRWAYKRRLRKKLEDLRQKHHREQQIKGDMKVKLTEIRAKPNQRDNYIRNGNQANRLSTQLKSLSRDSAETDRRNSRDAVKPQSETMIIPTTPTTKSVVVSVTLPSERLTLPTTTQEGTTSAPTGTFWTNANSNCTVVTVNEETNRIDLEHEVMAGTVHGMAKYCNESQLNEAKIQKDGPVLYSKNPMKHPPQLDSYISSSSDNLPTATPTSTKSVDNSQKKSGKSSETTVSMSTPTTNTTDISNSTNISTKKTSLPTIDESGESFDSKSDARPSTSTFPYYSGSTKKAGQPKCKRSEMEVRQADEGLSKSTVMDQRSSPGDQSRVPNVYELKKEADRQRMNMETELARNVIEARHQQRKNGIQRSTHLTSGRPIRAGSYASQMLQKEGEQVYPTSRATFKSPYDIRLNMDDSTSQRRKK